ncbi:MAG TPA: phospho-N-acetylmuramoyl-pentapeptide-transferase, partial [Caulobacteraceae bacterium]|nr:phospho-N-acetylmuramoyl-pentapeptide-transferase [Caulobacteraceae bacterium]
MFYLIYEQFAEYRDVIPFLNLLKYLTFRAGLGLLTGFIVAVAMGSRFIRWMQATQGRGQPIREEGIQRHVIEKAGTPTMGGFMILAGIAVGTLLWADLTNIYVWVVLGVTMAYGALGFLDDYRKVTKQTTDGVSGRMKLLIQVAVAVAACILLI